MCDISFDLFRHLSIHLPKICAGDVRVAEVRKSDTEDVVYKRRDKTMNGVVWRTPIRRCLVKESGLDGNLQKS